MQQRDVELTLASQANLGQLVTIDRQLSGRVSESCFQAFLVPYELWVLLLCLLCGSRLLLISEGVLGLRQLELNWGGRGDLLAVLGGFHVLFGLGRGRADALDEAVLVKERLC